MYSKGPSYLYNYSIIYLSTFTCIQTEYNPPYYFLFKSRIEILIVFFLTRYVIFNLFLHYIYVIHLVYSLLHHTNLLTHRHECYLYLFKLGS